MERINRPDCDSAGAGMAGISFRGGTVTPRKPTVLERVYDAMIECGVVSAYEVAQYAGIKLQSAKQAIRTLKQRGIIACMHSAPFYRLN